MNIWPIKLSSLYCVYVCSHQYTPGTTRQPEHTCMWKCLHPPLPARYFLFSPLLNIFTIHPSSHHLLIFIILHLPNGTIPFQKETCFVCYSHLKLLLLLAKFYTRFILHEPQFANYSKTTHRYWTFLWKTDIRWAFLNIKPQIHNLYNVIMINLLVYNVYLCYLFCPLIWVWLWIFMINLLVYKVYFSYLFLPTMSLIMDFN